MATKGLILLADTDRETAPVMDIALHHLELPYQLANLPNGQEVIRYLQREGEYGMRDAFPIPDLLLLDLKLKQVDALDVLRWIRRSPAVRHLTVVVLAESVFDSDIARAYAEGANSFLVKAYGFPAILQQLREVEREWLRRWRAAAPASQPVKRRARKRGKRTGLAPRSSASSLTGILGHESSGGGLGAQATL